MIGEMQSWLEGKLGFINAFDLEQEMTAKVFVKRYLATCGTTAGFLIFAILASSVAAGTPPTSINNNVVSLAASVLYKPFIVVLVIMLTTALSSLDYISTSTILRLSGTKRRPSIMRLMLSTSISLQLIYFFGAVFLAAAIVVETYPNNPWVFLSGSAILASTIMVYAGLGFIRKKRANYMQAIATTEKSAKRYVAIKNTLYVTLFVAATFFLYIGTPTGSGG